MAGPRIDEPFIRQMLEHLPNTTIRMFGTDLVYTLVGGGLLRELGVDPKAIEGTPVLVEFDASGRARAHDACAGALQGSSTSFELRSTYGRFLECKAVPVVDNGEIVGGLLISRDVSDRKQHELQQQAFARTDVLTGVANRLRLQLALRRAMHAGDPLALLALNLDDFNQFNAARGSREGDRSLRAVAHALEESTRPADTVARVGADEFAVIVLGANLDAANVVAERLRNALAALPFAPTAAIGIACSPVDANDSHALQRKAREAMLAQKNARGLRAKRAHS